MPVIKGPGSTPHPSSSQPRGPEWGAETPAGAAPLPLPEDKTPPGATGLRATSQRRSRRPAKTRGSRAPLLQSSSTSATAQEPFFLTEPVSPASPEAFREQPPHSAQESPPQHWPASSALTAPSLGVHSNFQETPPAPPPRSPESFPSPPSLAPVSSLPRQMPAASAGYCISPTLPPRPARAAAHPLDQRPPPSFCHLLPA